MPSAIFLNSLFRMPSTQVASFREFFGTIQSVGCPSRAKRKHRHLFTGAGRGHKPALRDSRQPFYCFSLVIPKLYLGIPIDRLANLRIVLNFKRNACEVLFQLFQIAAGKKQIAVLFAEILEFGDKAKCPLPSLSAVQNLGFSSVRSFRITYCGEVPSRGGRSHCRTLRVCPPFLGNTVVITLFIEHLSFLFLRSRHVGHAIKGRKEFCR